MKSWDKPFKSKHHRLIAVLCRFHLSQLSNSESMNSAQILKTAKAIKSLSDKLPKEKPPVGAQLKLW